MNKTDKICIIGLGYVGLPLAHAFSSKYNVVGFDIAQWRIDELQDGSDRTLELNNKQVKEAINNGIVFTLNIEDIKECNIYIITVPTPIDNYKKPDLAPLLKASETVGKVLNKGDIVIYESTVYPGCTEEDCVPILEKVSGLQFNTDFFCGYSPERINPGDKEHTVTKILKVTSGSTIEIGQKVNNLYASIITAGTHLAPTIKVAEAAKVIENAQRDVNISFVNELAVMFDKMGIDTHAVLEAAGTKWNFLKFKPGLVGGHCIGVDPYYLVHKAESLGYYPQVILSGRRINENMGIFVANKVIKLMIKKGHKIEGSKVLVLGITFKENCPDIRNSRVVDVVRELNEFGCIVNISDPWADSQEVKHEYNFDLLDHHGLIFDSYDAIILAVAHNEYKKIQLKNTNQVVFDIKGILDRADGRL
ncbi:MAG: nucleotide sugar dehydrogenase [Sulfuricurvum sp.]|nr:nucleotide sugar dehydrogenase [Sulfuricurvum sp.]MDP3023093.1 nucleotide sugar dehydrogenase [Sulfuricurvum sp.]